MLQCQICQLAMCNHYLCGYLGFDTQLLVGPNLKGLGGRDHPFTMIKEANVWQLQVGMVRCMCYEQLYNLPSTLPHVARGNRATGWMPGSMRALRNVLRCALRCLAQCG